MENFIKIRGARQHNLKNVSLEIPKYKLVVFTGLSGSGKSSLAFDTIYAEGQRRYVESLSSYARQFLGIMDKPDVDSIEGLSPSISIDQKSTSHNPRSTVGTVTEIYDYLRLLFARVGHPHCPNCGREISRLSVDQIVSGIFTLVGEKLQGSSQFRMLVLSPIVRDRKGEFSGLLENVKAKGFSKARIDRKIIDISSDLVLIKTNKHTIEVVIDKLSLTKKDFRDEVFRSNLKTRLVEAVEQATSLSDGLCIISEVLDAGFTFPENPKYFADHLFSERFACPFCNIAIAEIEPRTFSFNSPHGSCATCTGIGSLMKIDHLLVFNPNLTISEGGILPYARMFFHETWFSRVVITMAKTHDINLRLAIGDLPKEAKDKLLYGTSEQVYQVAGENRFGRLTYIYEKFPGIIADLERRFSETESDFVRTEIEKFMRREICPGCKGARLKPDALSITIQDKSIVDISNFQIVEAISWTQNLAGVVTDREKTIATPIMKEIKTRLMFLEAVGLEYLTLARGATTLSGGETQRIRLASQIGSGLSGVLYVLDEPSIGLHPRDNYKLIQTLKNLRDLGNTVIVVEHDREVMQESDWLFDFGPGAGSYGGQIVFSGTFAQILKDKHTLSAKYLKNPQLIQVAADTRPSQRSLKLYGAKQNNLQSVDVDFPLGKMICVTGVSGSGKSTLVVETLYHVLMSHFSPYHREKPGAYHKIAGLEFIDKVILVDQSPIGRTPRSNPATYTGVYTHIRDLFASISESKVRGYGPGRFSFNVKGGRCEACEGDGQIKIEMQFLSDVYVVCEVCKGARYNSETLEIVYKSKNIAEVLDMLVEEALEFFQHIPPIRSKLETLYQVGLSYIHLGQPATTLSGGEAQRIKLAAELSKRQTGKTFYILDEPTTGLHFADLEKLLHVLKRLTSLGNTVVVIEHNLDVIKNSDWIIDLGPEGGDSGGKIMAVGTVTDMIKQKDSYTGVWLQKIMKKKA